MNSCKFHSLPPVMMLHVLFRLIELASRIEPPQPTGNKFLSTTRNDHGDVSNQTKSHIKVQLTLSPHTIYKTNLPYLAS
ncbi:hypothetical protein M758_6G169400 [Ceratodon purpureus]|nr:hypothetical protein M758_6G169400 [Ceratodon purpureus]